MSKPVVTINANDDYDDVATTMLKNKIRRLVVVDNNKNLAGIIVGSDLARHHVEKEERTNLLYQAMARWVPTP